MEVKDAAGQRLAARWLREERYFEDSRGEDCWTAEDWSGENCKIGEGCDYETFQEFVIAQLYVAMNTNTTKEFMEKSGYENDPKEMLSDLLCEDDDDDWYQDKAEEISDSGLTYMGDL
ncbi:hypothetical protein [Lactobacillus sp. ESL0677]|uniref:hypothetical protein n=1 Tax=Lactobacillus sp. ESL0677 TaxID=2983208 RepID=UPI0023F6DC32|nr:hypothetical protein [Lactobacillus sp. ESL0677]WEV37701.1 hypothetical protein OZX76_03880 [Lactobacillus sp. ESL0677]